MLPTIDISNFLKKAVLAAGWVFINPIGRTLALATAGTAVFTVLVNLLVDIPDLQGMVENVSFGNNHGGFKDFLFYSLALDVAAQVMETFIRFGLNFIAIIFSGSVSLIAAMWVFSTKVTMAKAYCSLVR